MITETTAKNEINSIIAKIRKFISTREYSGVVLGVSGGIDSAVVLALLVRSLPKENILALILPERDSSKESTKDGIVVCKYFNVKYKIYFVSKILKALGSYSLFPPSKLFLRKVVEKYSKNRWERYEDPYILDLQNKGDELFLKGMAYYRSKHRARMLKMYFEAEKRNYCVFGTTNKTEDLLGLYVKWGDNAVDFEPISHLYKSEVYTIARYLDIPDKIIKKPPTPDLVPGINDEDAFKMRYLEVDKILENIENGIIENNEKYQRILKIIELSKKYRLLYTSKDL